MKEDRKGVTEFIAKKFSLDAPTAEETYKIMIQTLTDDGTIADAPTSIRYSKKPNRKRASSARSR